MFANTFKDNCNDATAMTRTLQGHYTRHTHYRDALLQELLQHAENSTARDGDFRSDGGFRGNGRFRSDISSDRWCAPEAKRSAKGHETSRPKRIGLPGLACATEQKKTRSVPLWRADELCATLRTISVSCEGERRFLRPVGRHFIFVFLLGVLYYPVCRVID